MSHHVPPKEHVVQAAIVEALRLAGCEVRFWRKVRKTARCWIWTAAANDMGYGKFSIGRKFQNLYAHRVAWMLAFGQIPNGLCVLHRCDNTSCVRPDHLFLGTQLDNVRDMHAKGRARFGVTCGEDHKGSKLTTKQVQEIRARFTGRLGEKVALAREFGVSAPMITNVVTFKNWRHVGS